VSGGGGGGGGGNGVSVGWGVLGPLTLHVRCTPG